MRLRTFNHARPDLAPYGFTCERWQGAVMRRPDRHNEIELNLMLQGAVTYLIGGQRITLGERRFGAFWAALPHQIIGFEGDPHYYVITLPLAWFLQCQLPPRFVDPLLEGQFLTAPDRTRVDQDAVLCRQWEKDLADRGENPPDATAFELHARLLRWAEGLPGGRARRPAAVLVASPAGATKAEQMAGYVARHYREPLTVGTVAREVKLHPNYAMTLFRNTFHTTLNEYLTHYRIAQAQRLLAMTDDKIIAVAFAAGFRTASRFYDAFQRACGCSPRNYRQSHRLGVGSSVPRNGNHGSMADQRPAASNRPAA